MKLAISYVSTVPAALTVTTQVAVAEPHVAVIVVVPAETPVTTPSESTVATFALDVPNVTSPLAETVNAFVTHLFCNCRTQAIM